MAHTYAQAHRVSPQPVIPKPRSAEAAYAGRAQVAVAQHDREAVAVLLAGPAEVGAPVLDRQHLVAEVAHVAPALAVAAALLGDREVEADRGAVEAGQVLLPGGQAGAVGAAHQQAGVRDRLAALDQAVAAGERVEVVELDGVVPGPGAAVGSTGRRWPRAAAASPRVRTSSSCSPHASSTTGRPWSREHQARVAAPQRALARLGLEAVDVADVVATGRPAAPPGRGPRCRPAPGTGAGAAELVVDVGPVGGGVTADAGVAPRSAATRATSSRSRRTSEVEAAEDVADAVADRR